jgi:hypothetical protein
MLGRAFEENIQNRSRRIATGTNVLASRNWGVANRCSDCSPNRAFLLEELRISTLIEYWCAAAVAEELHFTRAANRLHIDQSALSRHIQKLEASLGAKLFIPGERRFDLREAAEAFIRFAKKALLAAIIVRARKWRKRAAEILIAISRCSRVSVAVDQAP